MQLELAHLIELIDEVNSKWVKLGKITNFSTTSLMFGHRFQFDCFFFPLLFLVQTVSTLVENKTVQSFAQSQRDGAKKAIFWYFHVELMHALANSFIMDLDGKLLKQDISIFLSKTDEFCRASYVWLLILKANFWKSFTNRFTAIHALK